MIPSAGVRSSPEEKTEGDQYSGRKESDHDAHHDSQFCEFRSAAPARIYRQDTTRLERVQTPGPVHQVQPSQNAG